MTKRQIRQLVYLVALLILTVLGWSVNHNGKLDLPAKESPATPGYYPVVNVSDGDTIEVQIAGKKEIVRLIGIDTPETKDPRVPVQCFGQAASAKTHSLLDGKQVRLEADGQSGDRDKYQRLLRYVYLQDGTFLNQFLVQQGFAFAYTLFPNDKLEQFRGWEREARQNNRGLWAGCNVDDSTQKKQTTSGR